MQVPFDFAQGQVFDSAEVRFAQGRLSTPLKYASLRMTSRFLIEALETEHSLVDKGMRGTQDAAGAGRTGVVELSPTTVFHRRTYQRFTRPVVT